MSRVHDALKRAEQSQPLDAGVGTPPPVVSSPVPPGDAPPPPGGEVVLSLTKLLDQVQEVPFDPAPEAHLLDATKPQDAPTEEFRAFRTRMNHIQSLQPLHTVVVTSPSPAEGKSFAAVNFALAEAHLSGNLTLFADFDFRRPVAHHLFQIERSPGATEYLQGKVPLSAAIRKISGSNLYVMPAGEAVINPLELLNLREVKTLLTELPKLFNWVILDSPPLLFAADANLLSTLCDGTILVARVGVTTIDSVTRAMQSLCENNVLGCLVNGAERRELYSKYAYYHSYYYYSQSGQDTHVESKADADSTSAPPSGTP